MADEPRRSGRATKGQHTKNDEEPPDVVKKRAGKGGRSKAAKKAAQEETQEEEEDAIIRCICGYVVEDKSDKRAMICCDKCLAWQHNVCMGLSDDDDDLPDTYFCEQCKPEDHKETLAAMARGEKIWEIRQAEAQREEEERKARKRKGGRKSKGARVSEAAATEKKEASTPVAAQTPAQPPPPPPPPPPVAAVQTPSTPAPAPKPAPTKTEASNKRKAPAEPTIDTSRANDAPASSKARKVSTPKELKPPPRRQSSAAVVPARRDSKEVSLQAELVDNIEELHSPIRQRAAKALVKLFVESTTEAIKTGTFKLPTGQNEDAFGLRLGLTVEYSLYMNFWGHGENPNPPYGDKLRTIRHNVKDNPNLRDRLLNTSLSPHDLTNMTSLEMARKELQEETAQIRKENERQHVLVQEEGPRLRRTHKGDELIVDESQHMTNNEPTQGAPRRRGSDEAATAASPEQMSPQSPNAVELPQDIGRSPATARPLTVDTTVTRPKPTAERRKSTSTTFNTSNVYSAVDSPSTHRPIPVPNTPASTAPPPGAKADPEIDSLLKDESDEEPYSPMDYEMEPGTVWRGNIQMPLVAEFHGSAKWVAGADLHEVYPWSQLIPHLLVIEGRIPADRASHYLCELRWSKTTDVSVVALTPAEHQADREQFEKLFEYFTSRERYGVVKNSHVSNVRDVYVIPLEAGDAKKPEFIELLQDCIVEDKRANRCLLIVYVIKVRADGAPPPSGGATIVNATPMQPDINSPINTTGQHFRSPSISGPASGQPHMSPLTNQTSFQQPPPLVPGAGQDTQSSYPLASSKTGIEAARLVLGPELAAAPTVAQLLTNAPATSEAQMVVIKQVLEEDPRNREDWNAFVKGLAGKVPGGGT